MKEAACVIVSFPTTPAALAMERACLAHGLPGRLIPLPGRVSAGCGYAWSAPAAERSRIEAFLAERGLTFSAVTVLEP